jgi:hypothetical protein
VRVEYLGRQLVCQHCGGQLIASDVEGASSDAVATQSAIMERVDQLIDSVRFRSTPPR